MGPEDWRTEVIRCGCQRTGDNRTRWERARRASDLSPSLEARAFDGYDARHNRAALERMRAWTEAPEGWVVLWGGPGTGKTHLLAAAWNALAQDGFRALYVVVPSLLDFVRRGYEAGGASGSAEASARFEAVASAPVLLLDDLGAERRTEWSEETLFKLLDHRYRHELPTATGTNLVLDDLEPRIASRLQDRRLARVVAMGGPDMRRMGASGGKGARG